MAYIKSNVKFGHNNSGKRNLRVVSNMEQDGPNYLPVPQKVTVSSTSQTDRRNGTGGRQVRLVGMDENWNEQEEDVWLEGKSPAETRKVWISVDRMYLLRSGSSDSNAGKIWCGWGNVVNGVPTAKLCLISELAGQTEQLNFSVSANTFVIIKGISFNSSFVGRNGDSKFTIRSRDMSSIEGSWRNRITEVVNQGSVPYSSTGDEFIIDGPARVEVRAQSDSNGSTQSGTIRYEIHSM